MGLRGCAAASACKGQGPEGRQRGDAGQGLGGWGWERAFLSPNSVLPPGGGPCLTSVLPGMSRLLSPLALGAEHPPALGWSDLNYNSSELLRGRIWSAVLTIIFPGPCQCLVHARDTYVFMW